MCTVSFHSSPPKKSKSSKTRHGPHKLFPTQISTSLLVFHPFLKPRCCRVHPLDDVPPRHEDHEGRHAPQIVWGESDFRCEFLYPYWHQKNETVTSAGSWKHENNEVVFEFVPVPGCLVVDPLFWGLVVFQNKAHFGFQVGISDLPPIWVSGEGEFTSSNTICETEFWVEDSKFPMLLM